MEKRTKMMKTCPKCKVQWDESPNCDCDEHWQWVVPGSTDIGGEDETEDNTEHDEQDGSPVCGGTGEGPSSGEDS